MKEISNYNSHLFYEKGILKIEKINLEYIAENYGTPTYCYSANQIRKNYYNLSQSFKKIKPLICFAVKANFNKKILKIVSKLNLGADVVSMGELKESLASGISKKKIVFSGIGKTDEEINFALKKNIKQINVESEEELKEIEIQTKNLKKTINVCLRVNPNVDAKTHEKISTGRSEDKFGIDESNITKILTKYKNKKFINISGLSIHIGSQICTLNPFQKAFKKIRNLVLALRKKGIFLETLDLGGGVGIIYDLKKDKIFNITDYAEIIEKYFSDLNLEIILEPGRFLVGSSGILVSKVIRIKKGNKKNFLIIDAGMNNLLRPSLYNANHEIFPVKIYGKKKKYEVVGPICETSDVFRKDYSLSEVKKNDIVVICSVGAYGSSMMSNYNLRGKAKEIIIDGKKVL